VLFNIKKSHDEVEKTRTRNADPSDAAMLGPLRQDLTLAWNSLEPALRNITELSSQIQYILIIVTNWLAQRLQCGTKLGFMVDSVINHVFSGNVSHLVVAQLCCACAILGRWSDVHELKVLLASADPMTLQKRFEDYNFLARTSLYNLDLRTICELAETLAPVYGFFVDSPVRLDYTCFDFSICDLSPPATLDESALGFTPSSGQLSWKCAKLRSMRIKGPTDPEFREIKVNARQTLTILCTGRVGRMRNISNIQLVLNGAVSANEMDLSGYQVVKTVMPAGFDSNQDAQAAVAVDAVAASEDQDDSAESAKVEEIEESPTAGAFKHAEKPQLRRERLHIQRDADKKIRNVWKGTYLVTHELMENQEEDIEKEMMQIINAGAEVTEGADAENGAEAETSTTTEDDKPKEPNADSLLEGLMKILQKSAASQKQVVLRVESEIEMEFTPFINLIEAPSELAGLFSADLQRMHDYLMSLPHVDVTPVAAPAAPAVTVDKADESK
jgi:hypothetical protein